MTNINWEHTEYSERGDSYRAVHITWDSVVDYLGREHDGSPEDDQALTEALADAGAPPWVKNYRYEGFLDERGWGLVGPRIYEMSEEATVETLAKMFFEPESASRLRDQYRVTAKTTNADLEKMLQEAIREIDENDMADVDVNGLPMASDGDAGRMYLRNLRDDLAEEVAEE